MLQLEIESERYLILSTIAIAHWDGILKSKDKIHHTIKKKLFPFIYIYIYIYLSGKQPAFSAHDHSPTHISYRVALTIEKADENCTG